jgi:hypothetical protein
MYSVTVNGTFPLVKKIGNIFVWVKNRKMIA